MAINPGTVIPAGTTDTTDTTLLQSTLGNKNDNAVTTVGIVASVMAYVKGILNRINALRKAGTTGTYSHANNVAEQTIITATAPSSGESITMDGMTLDMTNCTQTKTVRLYIAVDAVNYRLVEAITWLTTDDDGLRLAAFSTARSWRVTIQSAVLEGVARNIPFEYVTEG